MSNANIIDIATRMIDSQEPKGIHFWSTLNKAAVLAHAYDGASRVQAVSLADRRVIGQGVCYGSIHGNKRFEKGYRVLTTRYRSFIETPWMTEQYKTYLKALLSTPEAQMAFKSTNLGAAMRLGLEVNMDCPTYITHLALMSVRRAAEHSYTVPITVGLLECGVHFHAAMAISELFSGNAQNVNEYMQYDNRHGDFWTKGTECNYPFIAKHYALLCHMSGQAKADGRYYGTGSSHDLCAKTITGKSVEKILTNASNLGDKFEPLIASLINDLEAYPKALGGRPFKGGSLRQEMRRFTDSLDYGQIAKESKEYRKQMNASVKQTAYVNPFLKNRKTPAVVIDGVVLAKHIFKGFIEGKHPEWMA